ncbi:MAG: hypothetical protein J6Q10_02560 [Clostridia bacterium]|nr:hypothetical protein [Clostridia bacterium]
MKNFNNRIKNLIRKGDIVYSATGCKPMVVMEIDELGFYTEEDYFLFDEHKDLYWLTKRGYEAANERR